jgi:tetratricopeptide (TPR) repeat protein
MRSQNGTFAITQLDQWLKVNPNPKAFLMRGRINFQFREYAKAIEDYSECYRADPTKLEAYIEEAEATYKLYGIEGALHKYNHLLVIYKTVWP